MKRNLLSLLLALTGSFPANAQYTFTINVSWSGNCSGFTAQMNQAISGFQSQAINGFPTRDLCEQTRAMCHQELGHIELVYYDVRTGRVIKRESTNCKLNVTTSPCTGRPMASTVGTINALGVSQGTSFYSANSANEIQNWSNDDMERMLALNSSYMETRVEELSMGGVGTDLARRKVRQNAFVVDASRPFRSLNVGEDGLINTYSADLATPKVIAANEILVADYLDRIDMATAPKLPMASTDEYISWIKEQFKLVTGCNIDDIIAVPSRTEEQSELMRNYREFEARLLNDAKSQLDTFLSNIERSPEKKEVDMAIVSLDCYGEDKDYIFKTDYRRLELDKLASEDPMRKLMEKLEECNQTYGETGFHAVLYQNDKTGEFAFAFEGSAFPGMGLSSNNTIASKIAPDVSYDEEGKSYLVNAFGLEVKIPKDLWADWGENNVLQAIGVVGKQFQMAKEIGDLINTVPELRDANINFTGHSLGGGLASIAGLVTGKPTYTFNAEGVSTKILENYGLLSKVSNGEFQITAYHTDNDPLTHAQQSAQKKMAVIAEPLNMQNQYAATAIGAEVNIGETLTTGQNYIAATVGTVAGGMAGTKELLSAVKDYGALGLVYGFYKGVKEGRETAESASTAYSMLYGHQMNRAVDQMIKRNSTTQSLWERMNSEKRAMNREMDQTRMRSLEQIYIITD